MQTLQDRASHLKQEQIRLRQICNDKSTASILLGLFGSSFSGGPNAGSAAMEARSGSANNAAWCGNAADRDDVGPPPVPEIEALLRRTSDEIPDETHVTELPSLILPGQHASKKLQQKAPTMANGGGATIDSNADDANNSNFEQEPNSTIVDIDFELLGKDRRKCTQQELDQIRRERNRMHAKRTRDRKRLFMEEMDKLCRQLERENQLLIGHLATIDPEHEEVRKNKADAEWQPESNVSTNKKLRVLNVATAALEETAHSDDDHDHPHSFSAGGTVITDSNRSTPSLQPIATPPNHKFDETDYYMRAASSSVNSETATTTVSSTPKLNPTYYAGSYASSFSSGLSSSSSNMGTANNGGHHSRPVFAIQTLLAAANSMASTMSSTTPPVTATASGAAANKKKRDRATSNTNASNNKRARTTTGTTTPSSSTATYAGC